MAAMPGAIGIGNGQITLDGLPLPHSDDSRFQLPGPLRVTAEHMEQALLGVKRRTATALGAPSVPKVKQPFPQEALLRALACLSWSRKVILGQDHNRQPLILQTWTQRLAGNFWCMPGAVELVGGQAQACTPAQQAHQADF